MFEKYGEFNTVEELNAAAEGQLKEGDINSLYEIAEENGIDREDAQDYASGDTYTLATLSMAAYGRINTEMKKIEKDADYMKVMIISVVATMLKGMCSDESIQKAVMLKGRRLEDIYNAIKAGASKHKHGNAGVSCGTDRELCEIIKSYYIDGKKTMEDKIEQLYAGIKDKENSKKNNRSKKEKTEKTTDKTDEPEAGEEDAEKED